MTITPPPQQRSDSGSDGCSNQYTDCRERRCRFAIVIPVYNGERYIQDCFDSILNQSHTDWIAICVNDGSTDKSGELLEKYQSRDNRINVYHKKNGGVSSARNFALEQLHAFDYDWITFIDIDDFIAPSRLNGIKDMIEKSADADIDYIRSYCQPVLSREPSARIVESCNEPDVVSVPEYFKRGDVGGYVAACLIKRSLLDKYSLRFPEDMKMLEDQVFSVRYALRAHKVAYYHTKDYFYWTPAAVSAKYGDTTDDIVRCINHMVSDKLISSEPAIADYFQKMWLPGKISAYLTGLLKPSNVNTVSLSRSVTISRYCRSLGSVLRFIRLKLAGKI